jgi:hypothetical protein
VKRGEVYYANLEPVPGSETGKTRPVVTVQIPLMFCAITMLLHGVAAASTRIEIDESGLRLAMPGWRGFPPAPPVRKASVSWDEVLAVRNRTELYHVAIAKVLQRHSGEGRRPGFSRSSVPRMSPG